ITSYQSGASSKRGYVHTTAAAAMTEAARTQSFLRQPCPGIVVTRSFRNWLFALGQVSANDLTARATYRFNRTPPNACPPPPTESPAQAAPGSGLPDLPGGMPGSGRTQTRQNSKRVVSLDGLQLGAAERRREAFHMIGGGAVGIVGAEHDLRGRDELRDRADGHRIGDLRGVVIEALQLGVDTLARELVLVGRPRHHLDLEALGHRGEHAATMREDEVDILVLLRGAAEDQAGDRSRGVGAVLDRRLGDPLHQVDAAIGAGRVRVDGRLAAVEFL